MLRPRFLWNWSCWDTWYIWFRKDLPRTVGITSLGPLGIYWERRN